jgi:hypothetical protein
MPFGSNHFINCGSILLSPKEDCDFDDFFSWFLYGTEVDILTAAKSDSDFPLFATEA